MPKRWPPGPYPSDAYKPHFSLAYVNAVTDPAPVRAALDAVAVEPVTTICR